MGKVTIAPFRRTSFPAGRAGIIAVFLQLPPQDGEFLLDFADTLVLLLDDALQRMYFPVGDHGVFLER